MKKFGELTREEQVALFSAWLEGHTIEFLNPTTLSWFESISCFPPTWSKNVSYRVKPIKPSVNWDHVHPDYNYLAENHDSRVPIFFSEEPTKGNYYWVAGKGKWTYAKSHASYTPGTCDWDKSLIKRPGK